MAVVASSHELQQLQIYRAEKEEILLLLSLSRACRNAFFETISKCLVSWLEFR